MLQHCKDYRLDLVLRLAIKGTAGNREFDCDKLTTCQKSKTISGKHKNQISYGFVAHPNTFGSSFFLFFEILGVPLGAYLFCFEKQVP